MGGRLWWPLVFLLAGGQAQDIEVLSHICKFGLYANGDRYRVVARFLALRKDVIHTVLYIVYAMKFDVFLFKKSEKYKYRVRNPRKVFFSLGAFVEL